MTVSCAAHTSRSNKSRKRPVWVETVNSPLPKAAIHYWRNSLGTPYSIGGFILPDNTAIASSTSSIARI